MKTYSNIYLKEEFNPTEVAKILNKSRQHVYNLEKENKLIRNENNAFNQQDVFDLITIKSDEKNLFLLIREFFNSDINSDIKQIKMLQIIHLLSLITQEHYPLNSQFFKRSYFKDLRNDLIHFLQHHVHRTNIIQDANFMRNFYITEGIDFISNYNKIFDISYYNEYNLKQIDNLIRLNIKCNNEIFEGFLDFFECILDSEFTQSDTYKQNMQNSFRFFTIIQQFNRETEIKHIILGG